MIPLQIFDAYEWRDLEIRFNPSTSTLNRARSETGVPDSPIYKGLTLYPGSSVYFFFSLRNYQSFCDIQQKSVRDQIVWDRTPSSIGSGHPPLWDLQQKLSCAMEYSETEVHPASDIGSFTKSNLLIDKMPFPFLVKIKLLDCSYFLKTTTLWQLLSKQKQPTMAVHKSSFADFMFKLGTAPLVSMLPPQILASEYISHNTMKWPVICAIWTTFIAAFLHSSNLSFTKITSMRAHLHNKVLFASE